MTTVVLNDELINEIIELGHYQTVLEAVEKILADYMQTQLQEKATFDSLYMNLDMDDDEIDDLFQRNQDKTSRALEL